VASEKVTMSDDSDTETRKVCLILERIAARYPLDSEESRAIRDAATAYILVQQKAALRASYEKLVLASGGELSEEMKANLQRIGIDPDALGEDEIS
jgi:hypothetical protein